MIGGDDVDRDGNDGVMCGNDGRLEMVMICGDDDDGLGTTMICGDDVDRDGNDGVMCGDDRRLE